MLYFIQVKSESGTRGPIKAGYTDRVDPKLRLYELQHGNHEEFTLIAAVPGSKADEYLLHEWIHSYHIRGEWYRPGRAIFWLIEELKKGRPLRSLESEFRGPR